MCFKLYIKHEQNQRQSSFFEKDALTSSFLNSQILIVKEQMKW